jgi:hypothetical protein
VKEPHIFVPFIHWLPKNSLRRMWLERNKHLLPEWQGHDLLTWEQRIETFYTYLNLKTYYRTNGSIRKIFNDAGFAVRFLGNWRTLMFHNVILITQKS